MRLRHTPNPADNSIWKIISHLDNSDESVSSEKNQFLLRQSDVIKLPRTFFSDKQVFVSYEQGIKRTKEEG